MLRFPGHIPITQSSRSSEETFSHRPRHRMRGSSYNLGPKPCSWKSCRRFKNGFYLKIIQQCLLHFLFISFYILRRIEDSLLKSIFAIIDKFGWQPESLQSRPASQSMSGPASAHFAAWPLFAQHLVFMVCGHYVWELGNFVKHDFPQGKFFN